MINQRTPDDSVDILAQVELLKAAIVELNGPFSGDQSTLKSYLQLLYEFECWDLYFKYIQAILHQGSGSDQSLYYQQVIGVVFNVTGDSRASARYLIAALGSLKLSFFLFWKSMILETMRYKDYRLEAEMLEALSEHSAGEFLERILERLALIYEEKLYREDLIYASFSRLLKANATNRRALIFFKNFSMQSQEWAKAETFLKTLIQVLVDTPEEVSYRLELARLYFHYLDEPDLAVDTLGGIEPKAGYRVFKAKFMLMFHAGEYKSSIEALRALEQLAEGAEQLALVYFHYASVYGSLNNMTRAFYYYEKSLDKKFHVVVARKYGAYSARYSYYAGIAKMLNYIAQHASQKSHQLLAKTIAHKFNLHG